MLHGYYTTSYLSCLLKKHWSCLSYAIDLMNCLFLFMARWGRGFGLVQYFVAQDSPINQPNSVLGIIFYSLQMGLGEHAILLQITEQHCSSVKIALHCNCGCILACTTNSLGLNIMWCMWCDLIFPKKIHLSHTSIVTCHLCFFFHCRVDPVQKSCNLFGLFLLGVISRLYLPRVNSYVCSAGLLHGVRVNIHRQLRPVLHQRETKEGNWGNEGEDGLIRLTCEIQPFFLFAKPRPHWISEILFHSISTLFTQSYF